jgi:large subunit ribosomal protein L9
MKNVEVLLRERVENLGRCGDVVRVATGYARNYLLPQRLAVPATEDNKRQIVRRAARMAADDAARDEAIAATVQALSALELTTSQKADEGGHLYGSVSVATVVELAAAAGHKVEEKSVRLDAPIKTVGLHKVPVHVHANQVAHISLTVAATE